MPMKDTFKLMPAFMYGFFGITAMTMPTVFWEDTEIVPVALTFWKGSASVATVWWARAFGTGLFTIALGPFIGMNDAAYFKQVLVFSLLGTINFVQMLLTTEDVVVEWMWWCYVPLFSFFAAGSAYYLKKPKKAAPKTPIIGGLKERTTRSKSPAKKK